MNCPEATGHTKMMQSKLPCSRKQRQQLQSTASRLMCLTKLRDHLLLYECYNDLSLGVLCGNKVSSSTYPLHCCSVLPKVGSLVNHTQSSSLHQLQWTYFLGTAYHQRKLSPTECTYTCQLSYGKQLNILGGMGIERQHTSGTACCPANSRAPAKLSLASVSSSYIGVCKIARQRYQPKCYLLSN